MMSSSPMCSSGCSGPRCAPAASSPRCSPRTSARRRPASTTARSRSSPRGRDRGAGIRVVVGDTTGFAHTADLSEPGLRAAAEAAAAAARGGGGGARIGRPHPPADATAPNVVETLPGRRRQGRARSSCCTRADEAARSQRRRRSCRCRPATATAAGASSWPTRDGLLADRRPGRARCFARQRRRHRRHRHADRVTSRSATRRLRAVRPLRRRGAGPRRPPSRALTKLGARPAPSGHDAGRDQARRRRRAVPRGVRPRPRGRPRRQGRVGVHAAASASWSPRRSSRSSTTARWAASGARIAIDDEGHPASATCSSRTACSPTTCGTSCGPARRAGQQSGNGRRQSYQHLPMVRMTNTYVLDGTDDPDDIVARHRPRRVRRPPRRRPGQHRHRRLRVRHDRGVPDRERRDHRAAARGQPHRQRPAGAARHRRCSATTSPWAARARAARTARACRSATACRRCGCTALTIGGTAA